MIGTTLSARFINAAYYTSILTINVGKNIITKAFYFRLRFKQMETNSNTNNYFNILVLINRAAVALRGIFMKRWKQKEGKDWLNTEENANELIDRMEKITFHSLNTSMRKSVKSGDINKWDLTLLGTILKSIKINVSIRKNSVFRKQVKEENRKIDKLLKIRNDWAHNSNMTLNDNEFNELWNEMTSILVSFGEPEEELEILKLKEIITETKNDNEIVENAKQLKDMGK